MFQQFYEPHPALKGFVNNIMIHKVKFKTTINTPSFSIPPLPEHCLFFYIRDTTDAENSSTHKKESLSSSIILGPHTNRYIISPGRDHLMVKVGFQPGGLYRFLGIPMRELLCQDSFDAADLIRNDMYELNNRLKEATSIPGIKNIIEGFLLKHLDKLKASSPIDEVFPLIIKHRGLIKIDKLASHACLSIRQFERVFQQRIGLPPKYFSRLVRFSQAWIMKEQKPGITWTKIAHECGYFDQMHLIRDFQEFAGVTPSIIETEFLNSHTKYFNRLFG